jgi:hypothetical protein
MGEGAIDADGQNLGVQILDFFVFEGNCRQFGGSDKGEIPGIEIEHHPLAAVIRQLDGLDFSLHVALGDEVRRGFSHSHAHLLLSFVASDPLFLFKIKDHATGHQDNDGPPAIIAVTPLKLRHVREVHA